MHRVTHVSGAARKEMQRELYGLTDSSLEGNRGSVEEVG